MLRLPHWEITAAPRRTRTTSTSQWTARKGAHVVASLAIAVHREPRVRPWRCLSHRCAYCGGLGHRVTTCPKLESHRSKQQGQAFRDQYSGSSTGAGSDW
jgi:hypothetical protein